MVDYIEFEDWLKEEVLDPRTLHPEAKKAFQENYDKLKKEGNLPQKKPKGKYDLDKFKNPDGSINIDYALEAAKQSLNEHKNNNEKKNIPEDLSKLKPKNFTDTNGKIDINFALKVAAQAASQYRK